MQPSVFLQKLADFAELIALLMEAAIASETSLNFY
jgi:hypothetical protein